MQSQRRSQGEEQDGLDPFPAESEAALELLAIKALPGLTGARDDGLGFKGGEVETRSHIVNRKPTTNKQAMASSPPSRHPRRLPRAFCAPTSGG